MARPTGERPCSGTRSRRGPRRVVQACDQDWTRIGSKCYKVVNTMSSQTESGAACRQEGSNTDKTVRAKLATVNATNLLGLGLEADNTVWVAGEGCKVLENGHVRPQPCKRCAHKVLCQTPLDRPDKNNKANCRKDWKLLSTEAAADNLGTTEFLNEYISVEYSENNNYWKTEEASVNSSCYKISSEAVEYEDAAAVCHGSRWTQPKLATVHPAHTTAFNKLFDKDVADQWLRVGSRRPKASKCYAVNKGITGNILHITSSTD